jgi:leucyl aminopeptidase (aminopeptidase T)
MITNVIHAMFRVNLAIAPHESVLVFTDTIRADEVLTETDLRRRQQLPDIAQMITEASRTFTKNITCLQYPACGGHGVEPPLEVWQAAFGEKTISALEENGFMMPLLTKKISDQDISDVVAIVEEHASEAVNAVIALANFSTSHTRFRQLLTAHCATRYASMPLFDFAMFEGPMCVDWNELARKTHEIAKAVSTAETVLVVTEDGTNMSFSKKNRQAMADTGIISAPGSFSNLPAGEVFFAPVEGSAQGTMVLHWAPTRRLSSPLVVTVERGIVTEISGSEPYREVLHAQLNERPENRNIAELGIGTNERAHRPDNILESEKILGTIHIAMGDNSSFGGTVKTPFHQDFVFFRPTVTLIKPDGTKMILMENGLMQS